MTWRAVLTHRRVRDTLHASLVWAFALLLLLGDAAELVAFWLAPGGLLLILLALSLSARRAAAELRGDA
jgi:hypothetical protein